MSNPNHLLWLDLETSQTDPNHPHAAVLEIGAIITDWSPDLVEVARGSMLIRPDGTTQDHELMWQNMLPVVQQMHTSNGLWREATTSSEAWGLAQADHALTAWLTERIDGPVPLAGSGVGHLDLPFVKAFLPQLATRLTYWPIDIGNVRRLFQLAGRGDIVDLPTDIDAKPHRALGDVELHVAEARRYLQLIQRAIPVDLDDGARL
jgi:oligoribonuclease (3'-5' exoribonuclease)